MEVDATSPFATSQVGTVCTGINPVQEQVPQRHSTIVDMLWLGTPHLQLVSLLLALDWDGLTCRSISVNQAELGTLTVFIQLESEITEFKIVAA